MDKNGWIKVPVLIKLIGIILFVINLIKIIKMKGYDEQINRNNQ